MRPNPLYKKQCPEFWALVRYASEQIGYSKRVKRGEPKSLRRYTYKELDELTENIRIENRIVRQVCKYLNYRAILLENHVENQLMKREMAKKLFNQLKAKHKPKCQLPFNKQRGTKRHHAYFTCIINILTEATLGKDKFDESPSQLSTIKDANGKLVATLSRRIDGAYPRVENPHAVWEVKEYYGTTTFGSRVADGVYETSWMVTKSMKLLNLHRDASSITCL